MQAARSLMAQEKQMSPSASLVFLVRSFHHNTFIILKVVKYSVRAGFDSGLLYYSGGRFLSPFHLFRKISWK